MIRIADRVTCWTAEGDAGEFRPQPGRQVFGSAVEAVQLAANPGFTNNVVDLRIKDLRIRKLTPDESRAIASKLDATAPRGMEGDEREPEATRSRRWLLLGLLCFLWLPTASVVWLWMHRRREKDRAAPPPSTASAPLAVQCSGCEKKFRARAELAGKRVKCPQCGQAVLIPGLLEQ
jgi:ribosomal protein S27E